ncbi:MAG: glutamate formimidoyltransferase [Syntrophales bacterium]
MKIIECVPNFSEGRNRKKIDLLASAASSLDGVRLLDVCVDHDHNRTVLTLIGNPENIVDGAQTVCSRALELIDMRFHTGVHPRIGAVDVVPFIALKGAVMADAVQAAHRFGYAFGKKNGIPVFFYGEAAVDPTRRELPHIRRGGYEGLRERIKNPGWKPDAGPAEFNLRWGASAVGAREPLIAFNVNLATSDARIAREIAGEIRQAGGGLPCVRAIGVFLKSRNIAQVSINLINYKVTSIRTVFESVRDKASRRGAAVLESELVGLIPEAALEGVDISDLKIAGFSRDKIIETHL